MTHTEKVQDADAVARQARFGVLPERIRPEDMVVEVAATQADGSRDAYNVDMWLVRMAG